MSSIKRTKDPGPSTYDTSKSLSSLKKSATNISFGGLGVIAGAKDNIAHTDKLKVKGNRFIDQVIRNASKKGAPPGVGHYKVDKGYERKASLPLSIKVRRH